MPELIVTGPAAEPLHLTHVKDHLRESGTGQDKVIPVLVAAARRFAEMRTQRQLIHARYQYQLNAFPQGYDDSCPSGPVWVPGNAIRVPRGPVGRVVSITYLDTSSTRQTLVADTDYVVNTAMHPALITPPFGKVWPVALPQPGSVIVTYDVGHASPVSFSGANVTVRGPMVWAVNDVVRFSNSGGALPTEFATFTDYYVKTAPGGGVYTFSATLGGSTITSTGGGSGQSYLGEVPEGILSWMLVRISTLYENREEVAVLQRGKLLEPLAYVDGLLDPYMPELM